MTENALISSALNVQPQGIWISQTGTASVRSVDKRIKAVLPPYYLLPGFRLAASSSSATLAVRAPVFQSRVLGV
jgi:hypothetical protein